VAILRCAMAEAVHDGRGGPRAVGPGATGGATAVAPVVEAHRFPDPRADLAERPSPWAGHATVGAGRTYRELLHIESSGERIFAALAGAPTSPDAPRFVLCPGWGQESALLLGWMTRLADAIARSGGCAVIPHWPGFQDGPVTRRAVDLPRLVQVCADAATAGADRCGGHWSVGGIRVGAAVAAAAAPVLDAPAALLVQPILDPAGHLRDTERAGRRFHLRLQLPPGWAFGYRIPPGLQADEATAVVTAALPSLPERTVAVCYREPRTTLPPGVRTVTLPGTWRKPHRRDHQLLLAAASRWVSRLPGAER
jgi:hypothetical protein